MFKKLDKLIAKHGLALITVKLGYRSMNTILTWRRNGKVPDIAKERVKQLIEDMKNE